MMMMMILNVLKNDFDQQSVVEWLNTPSALYHMDWLTVINSLRLNVI